MWQSLWCDLIKALVPLLSTLHCVSDVYALGGWRGWLLGGGGGFYRSWRGYYSLQQHAFHSWQTGAELDPYPSRHHFTPLSASRPGKKYTWLFKDKLVKAIAALSSPPLCRIDFLLTKKEKKRGRERQFSTPIKGSDGRIRESIFCIYRQCIWSNSAGPHSQYICPTLWLKDAALTVHLHIKVYKNAPSERSRQTEQRASVSLCRAVRGSHVSSRLEAWRQTGEQLNISACPLPSTSLIPRGFPLLEFQFIPQPWREKKKK